mgnify:CR=1 FL=1
MDFKCPYCDGQYHYSNEHWPGADPDYTWMCGFCHGEGRIAFRRWLDDRAEWLYWQTVGRVLTWLRGQK